MSKIASLPNLKVLKLGFNAFLRPKWEVEENGFPGLVKLKWAHGSFKSLEVLRIKHCYKFEELHLGDLPEIGEIEVVDCSPLVEWHVKHNTLEGLSIYTASICAFIMEIMSSKGICHQTSERVGRS
ncbi:hypothetical protein ACS0TY_007095 [Phlomoides rotata]